VLEEQSDYQRASSAYLIWPLALAAIMREAPEASRWSRIHTRQALAFGILATLGMLVVMALPLVVVIADSSISTGATEAVYTVGLVADILVFALLATAAVSCAARAGRGELFTIPLISPLSDRVFTMRR
jgi:uncharacterized Tic20 family protein